MNNLVLILHVVTALLFIGPVTVAVSLFPRIGKAALAATPASPSHGGLQVLLAISRTYALLSLLVPALGLGIMFIEPAYFQQPRFHAAIALSVVAWLVLLLLVVPAQRKFAQAIGAGDPDMDPVTAADATVNTTALLKKVTIGGGVFNLLWLISAVLMVIH
ncbi:DUF2269 domain-containing protein [Corynebacterium choanae]|uniref:DUF2269 domain-containing protein n=1 Tax=Corynebacterium choanae TaxID=1862358 RepID=A0A3G6J5B4_9CORY|nr:DUF2269 domain-containing protein [Corynebacterium choanae]AZA13285.1 hypothetical protein CCHOA_04380 [Corynebacterium choanae]